ncbi:hypothetical protein [Shewanella algae]|uniref:hypothetical protein n=1 Tax=Shewanella algae TaxID=38313 RepID=UPI003C3531A6
MTSIVIDTCVLRLYDAPLDPNYTNLFRWVQSAGTLYVSQKLVNEYIGTGNRNIQILLSALVKHADNIRLVKLKKSDIESFDEDKRYNYTCNKEDVYHAKLVFLSPRKKLVSQDRKILADVNGFKKVNGIQPAAEIRPQPAFYE